MASDIVVWILTMEITSNITFIGKEGYKKALMRTINHLYLGSLARYAL